MYFGVCKKKVEQHTLDCFQLVTQTVKNLPAIWETLVQTLGWEDPPKKGKAIHSSILA